MPAKKKLRAAREAPPGVETFIVRAPTGSSVTFRCHVRLPFWFLDAGGFRSLKPAACKLLITMMRFAKFKSAGPRGSGQARGECFPSVNLLARQSGLSRRGVLHGLKQLESANVIQTFRRAGGDATNVYAILLMKAGEVQNLHHQECNPCRGPGVINAPELDGKKQESSTAAAAVRAALIEAGIGHPKRDQLEERWRNMPRAAERIQETAATMRRRRKGPGAIINELEAMADSWESTAAAREERNRQAAAQEQTAQTRRAEEAAHVQHELQQLVADLADLSRRGLLDELAAEVRRRNPRNAAYRGDPKKPGALGAAIRELARERRLLPAGVPA